MNILARAGIVALAFITGNIVGQLQQECPHPPYPELSWVRWEHIQQECGAQGKVVDENACIVEEVRKFYAQP